MEASAAGVDPQDILAKWESGQPPAEILAAAGVCAPAGAAVPTEAKVVPTETREQQLERELIESQAETQQVRRLAQVAEEGRVVGSGGGGTPGGIVEETPSLGTIEPGIKFAYKNGLITDAQLTEQVGSLLANMLKSHMGGAV